MNKKQGFKHCPTCKQETPHTATPKPLCIVCVTWEGIDKVREGATYCKHGGSAWIHDVIPDTYGDMPNHESRKHGRGKYE